jgi:hypothetical protein
MTNDELNRIMGEKAMDWHWGMLGYPQVKVWRDGNARTVCEYATWNPATDANDTLKVLGELGNKGISYTIRLHSVNLYDSETGDFISDAIYDGINSLLPAICEAAAKAVGDGRVTI